jgi:2,3-bisphosphoglycerate-dependent phosphoglycerate mutase
MHLYVIRHGQSFVNLPDWDGINPDLPLTDTGKQQADALANWLPARVPRIDAIYCSTLRRPRETVAPLAAAYDLEVQYDHRLRELGNNRIDHTPYSEDALPGQSDWAAYLPTEKPFARLTKSEGGESIMHFRIRVAAFIEEMVERHLGQRVIAVAHGGVMDAVFDYCFGISPWRRCAVYTYNTGITYFEYIQVPGRESWRLHYHNMIEHLHVLGYNPT